MALPVAGNSGGMNVSRIRWSPHSITKRNRIPMIVLLALFRYRSPLQRLSWSSSVAYSTRVVRNEKNGSRSGLVLFATKSSFATIEWKFRRSTSGNRRLYSFTSNVLCGAGELALPVTPLPSRISCTYFGMLTAHPEEIVHNSPVHCQRSVLLLQTGHNAFKLLVIGTGNHQVVNM